MELKTVFNNAVETAFTVFASLVKEGGYIVTPENLGWDDTTPNLPIPMGVIVNGLTQKQLKNTRFYTQIEPTDTVIMVKGSDILNNGIRVRNSDRFTIKFSDTLTVSYEIQAHETDPADALYLILLREKP